ncbi:hypothetical protein, partial [Pseudoalteromonas luteoviolacea]|uniref:hypothetical protein n=1 Tax=Pseudoalteromonas luteoviolacea TaxID=43657 RepID=UPI000AEF8BE0
SYVLNNPMSYTDPSGYLFSAVMRNVSKKINRQIIRGAVKVFGADVVSIVGNIASGICGLAVGACSAMWNYEFTRAMGGTPSQALKTGAIAGMTAQAFYEIGQYFKVEFDVNPESGRTFAELEFGQQVQWAGSHALVGGISSVASGGKFANGARTAAMMHLLNAEGSARSSSAKKNIGISKERAEEMLENIDDWLSEYFPEVPQTDDIVIDLGIKTDFALPNGTVLILDLSSSETVFEILAFHEKLHVYMFKEVGGFLGYQNAVNVNEIHNWIKSTSLQMQYYYSGRSPSTRIPFPNLKSYPKPIYNTNSKRGEY